MTDPLAIIIEHRDRYRLTQSSHVFFGEVVGDSGEPHFEPYEIEEGTQVKWVSLSEVESILVHDAAADYDGPFSHTRDLAIWKFYQKLSTRKHRDSYPITPSA